MLSFLPGPLILLLTSTLALLSTAIQVPILLVLALLKLLLPHGLYRQHAGGMPHEIPHP